MTTTDHHEIVQLTHAYCWALDSKDFDGLDQVFTDDATALLRSALLEGRHAIKQRIRSSVEPLDATQHTVTNHMITVDGDRATSRCYLHSQHVRRGTPGGELFVIAGRYEDQLVRTSAGWRIAHRTLVEVWQDGNLGVVRPGRPGGPLGPADFQAIERLVHRYIDAVIHRDGVQWSSTWAEDAVWDLGRGRLVNGREAIAKLWYGAMAGMHAVYQAAHSSDVRYGDSVDHAAGRCYINEWFRRADGTNSILLAHYDDEYVRVDGEWLFSRRLLVVHYSGAPDLSAEFFNRHDALVARGIPSDV
jgi:ketosteroid isomerase-like protein